ncbi:P-loop ATPase, Sll1717 family [Paenibacillus cellulositrophicus]|uniref:P-loop ATPase, Sll1717 family n=1 Tax=Paenibacillus cellulositrophicus TaxID=562959 RepID=UPI003D965349
MKSLESILSFGSVDADNDEYLLQSFEDHEAYLNVLEHRKFLVSGRKGSGKTAIYKKIITTKSPDFFTFGHTFSDYPWHYHDKQAKIGVPDYDKYTHSWKYLILLTSAKIVLNQDHSLPYDDTSLEYMSKIENFVVDSYGTRDPDITQIFSPSKHLKLKPTMNFDLGLLKAGISPDRVPITELPVIVSEVNRNLTQYIMSSLNPENNYFICFDQLDLGFDPNSPDYKYRLIGLLLAARDLNLKAKEFGKKFSVTVFLRDDIYEMLQFEDKNKITENFYTLIEWDTSRTRGSLKSLMEKRFKATIGELHEDIRWDQVFDETQEMTGHLTKYRFITDRTFLRPRDIIKFSNAVLESYKHRMQSENVDKTTRFINQDLHDARDEYGRYFQREIDDEIHKHIPLYKKYLEILKGIGVYRFTKEQFLAECKNRASILPDTISPIYLLKDLFDFSIIGYYKRGGKGFGGSEYVFKFKDPQQEFDESSDTFQVHLGLIDALSLKRYEKSTK